MSRKKEDQRWEILILLRLRDEQPGGPLPDLTGIATALQQPTRDVRRACDALEGLNYVDGAHGMGGDHNPSYCITNLGKAALYNHDHERA